LNVRVECNRKLQRNEAFSVIIYTFRFLVLLFYDIFASRNIQTGSGAQCEVYRRLFPEVKQQGPEVAHSHLPVLPRLRMSGSILLLPPYAFMVFTGNLPSLSGL
jgi:hypothetical protein